MRVLSISILALATLHHALAQPPPRDDPTSLSSIVGPFSGPTLIFAPGISAYDFISAVGSTGTNDETTTFKAYASSTMADPENRSNDIPGDGKVGKQAYATFTCGPTTYEGAGVLPATTISLKSTTHTYAGGPQITQCSYTTEPRKAVCTYAETDAMEGATRESERVETLNEEGWVSVYVLLDPNAATTTTEEGGAEETGAAETGSMTTVAQTGSGSVSVSQAPAATSTQAGGAAEVTAWVNAVVVVAAAAAMAM